MTQHTLTAAVRRIYRDAATRSDLSDADLLARFAAMRDEAAFEVLVWRHGPMVLGVCRRVLGNPHDAEDAFQTTFVTLASRAGSVRSSLAAWLYQVAYHAALRLRKDRVRRATATLPNEVVAPEPEQAEASAALDEELGRLPSKYRDPLVLAYLEGQSNQQVADALGCPVGTIFTRLSRGRDRLRKALARRGIGSLPVLVSAVVPPALVGRVVASASMVQTSGVLGGLGGAIVLHKMKAVVAVLLLASAGLAGVLLPSRPAAIPAKARHAAPPPAGERLPEGALARLGQAKFRHAGVWEFVCLPGGKTVLTSGMDGVLRTWDLATGKQLRAVTLETTRESPNATLSLDGRMAAAHCQGKIVLWDAATGKERKRLDAPKGGHVDLDYSNDGHTLAVWTHDQLDFHDLKTGRVRTFALPPRHYKDSTFQGRFSPDGKYFSVGGGTRDALCIYDVAKGKELHRLFCFAMTSIFSPDRKTLIVSSHQDDAGKVERSLRVYDVATGKELKRVIEGVRNTYHMMTYSPDGKKMFCWGGMETACVMDARTFAVLHEWEGDVNFARYTPDGRRIISANWTRLRLWEPTTGKEVYPIEGEFGRSYPLSAFSPDGRWLASGGWSDSNILLWDLKTGKVVRTLPLGGLKQCPCGLSFSPDGRTLTVPQYEGFIQTWDVATGKQTGSLQLDKSGRLHKELESFSTLRLSPDGKTVSTLGRALQDGKEATRLCLWDRKSGKRVSEHLLPEGIRKAAWRPDGLAVALPLPGGLTLLDVKTGKPIWQVPGRARSPIAASPDARLIVTGKTPTTVEIWESATGKLVATLEVGTFAHIAIASDTRTLVASDAERIRVVDMASGNEVLSRPLPVVMRTDYGATFVNNLTLAPDGRRAFTAYADGTGIVWDIARKRPARKATEQELAAWWADLASDDAGRAWRAAWALTDAKAGAFLEGRLRSAPAPDAALLALVAALDANGFAERESAEKALAKLGAAVVPALRVAREEATSAEVRTRLDRLLERHGPFTAGKFQRLRAADVLRALDGK